MRKHYQVRKNNNHLLNYLLTFSDIFFCILFIKNSARYFHLLSRARMSTVNLTDHGLCLDGTAQESFLREVESGGGTVVCTDAQGRFPTGPEVGGLKLHPVSIQCDGEYIRFDWPHAQPAWFKVPVRDLEQAIKDARDSVNDE